MPEERLRRVPLSTETKRAFLAAIEKAHGPGLRRFLAARLRSVADMPDLAQEVYLRLLRIENHEAIRNPQAYLYTVASHVLHQHAMRRAVNPEVVDLVEVAPELTATPDSDPAEQVAVEQRFEELGRALEKASPKAYATLVMHRCEGVPLKEVGHRLGVSYTMAKRYLAKALAYCQKRLEESE